MKLVMGFLLGVLIATAGSLYAQSSGTWFNPNTGEVGTYQQQQNGSTYFQGQSGMNGYLNQQPALPFTQHRNPC